MNRVILMAFLLVLPSRADWNYSWALRTDQSGQPAGAFDSTPFPIWETNTTYTVTNDESPNGKTFTLGTLYFVDGGMSDDTGDGLTLATAKKFITSAYNLSAAGNKTILIRGAHDDFDGIYTTNATDGLIQHWHMKAGTDDTHRWTISGYGQERPILDGALYWDGSEDRDAAWDCFSTSSTQDGYWTLQRLTIRNRYGDAVYIGSSGQSYDFYASLIDIIVTNCCALNTNLTEGGIFVQKGNSPVYVTDTYGVWLYHVTACHSTDHLIKIGGSSGNCIVEWCKAFEAGYWDDLYSEASLTEEGGARGHYEMLSSVRARAFDFPNDTGQCGSNNVLRYSIGYKALFGAVQIRNSANFDCHHNEVYQSPAWQQLNRTPHSDQPFAQIQVRGNSQSTQTNTVFDCLIHDNFIHSSLDTNATAWGVCYLSPTNSVYFYNNVSWSNANYYGEVWHDPNSTYSATNRLVVMYNNTIVGNISAGTYPSVAVASWAANEIVFSNNIVVQMGDNAAANFAEGVTNHGDNIYYYPSGSLGFTSNADEVTGQDPLFVRTGAAVSLFPYQLTSTSPGVDAGTMVGFSTNSINGALRGTFWDIGAYEYIPPQATAAAIRVGNLRSAP